jgi:hypothetical protein
MLLLAGLQFYELTVQIGLGTYKSLFANMYIAIVIYQYCGISYFKRAVFIS